MVNGVPRICSRRRVRQDRGSRKHKYTGGGLHCCDRKRKRTRTSEHGIGTLRAGLTPLSGYALPRNRLTDKGETSLGYAAKSAKIEDGSSYQAAFVFALRDGSSCGRYYETLTHLVDSFEQVYSAGGDDTGVHSCRLCASSGTSMACPIVAGASALVSTRGQKGRIFVLLRKQRHARGASVRIT